MVCKILTSKVCEFSTFLPGIVCVLAVSNVKCFIEAQISGVVFAHNNLDHLNAFIVFVWQEYTFSLYPLCYWS